MRLTLQIGLPQERQSASCARLGGTADKDASKNVAIKLRGIHQRRTLVLAVATA